jgi:glycerophosphoryl diester phosphodiesterase
MRSPLPALVAHRGYARRYPENTLEGLAAAIAAGAPYVEFDVQLTADHVPVLLHDPDLRRVAGLDRRAAGMTFAELRRVEVNERARLGAAFSKVRVPALSEAVQLLQGHPRVGAFVEMKEESLAAFGTEIMVDRVLEVAQPVLARCAVISFDRAAIVRARACGAPAIGWVLATWSAEARERAAALAPEYLFCDHRIIPPGDALWPGPWRWAIYEVADADAALALAARGAEFIETMAVGELLADPRLAPGALRHG